MDVKFSFHQANGINDNYVKSKVLTKKKKKKKKKKKGKLNKISALKEILDFISRKSCKGINVQFKHERN